MAVAYIFPGQGAQFSGMGKHLYLNDESAKQIFEEADRMLGFTISEIMFEGSDESLKQTNVTQPSVFIHSIAAYQSLQNVVPDMVAGHSLGEFSALVAAKVLKFADALKLVELRAQAMQKACDLVPGTMAAVLALDDAKVEEICAAITAKGKNVVVAANYNSPGQIVISGDIEGVQKASEELKAAGAKRVLSLPVGGAFHSPLMAPAKKELEEAIHKTKFNNPICPVYQNTVAKAVTNAEEIKANLISQLTGSVKWTQSLEAMIADGAIKFVECGPGKVLQGLVQKISKDLIVEGVG